MTHPGQPYALPAELEPDLARVEAYWRSLLRGGAQVPFADDLHLDALPDLAPRLLLLDVFARPERFRFSLVGEELKAPQGDDLLGRFVDEVRLEPPLDYLRSQCSATVEAATSTCFAGRMDESAGYRRLLLPLWGDGRVNTVLGIVEADRA